MKIWISLAFAGLLALAACNTAEGLGRDVGNTGDWISDKASGGKKKRQAE